MQILQKNPVLYLIQNGVSYYTGVFMLSSWILWLFRIPFI